MKRTGFPLAVAFLTALTACNPPPSPPAPPSPVGPLKGQINVLNVTKSQNQLAQTGHQGVYETLEACKADGIRVYNEAVGKKETGTMGMVCVDANGRRFYYEMINGRFRDLNPK